MECPVSVTCEGESYGWMQPAEWLDVAASVVKVEVVTAQDDESLMWCGAAMDYENDRSACLSQFTTSLTVFTFLWGAFEAVAKIMGPASIPRDQRKDGNDSLTARVVYALKSVTPDGAYECMFARLHHFLTHHPEYSACVSSNSSPATSAEAGDAIDLVRAIRNKFAHGAATLPQRDDWDGKDSLDNQVVRLSCRAVLLTIQFMLRAFFKGQSFQVEIYEFGGLDDESDDERGMHEIHQLLETLHIA
jgi:hypothetical protein